MLFRLIHWFLRRLQFGCSKTDKSSKALPLLIMKPIWIGAGFAAENRTNCK